MIIYLPNPKTGCDDRGAIRVDLGDHAWGTHSIDPHNGSPFYPDGHFEYLDTHLGTFKRSLNYWHASPYGWQAVSWG